MNIQPTTCILLGLLLGVIIGLLIAKRKDFKSQSEGYPKWHNVGNIFDEYIKLGDRIHISFIESDSERTTLILKMYDKEARLRNMLFTAAYYCVQNSSSRLKVSPGNFIVIDGAHNSTRLARFHWTENGPVMTKDKG